MANTRENKNMFQSFHILQIHWSVFKLQNNVLNQEQEIMP